METKANVNPFFESQDSQLRRLQDVSLEASSTRVRAVTGNLTDFPRL